jgi:predicted small lipoprotein YifL
MVQMRSGWGFKVRRPIDRLKVIALTAVMVAAGLALADCGRKGPLDAPPSAALTPPPAAARPSLGEENESLAGSQAGAGATARPQAAARQAAPPPPAPQKTSFFLDFLLGR